MAIHVDVSPTALSPIKWAGGKRQLLPQLLASQPISWNRYLEPFAGGAALFFALGRPGSYLSDTNGDLIRFYQVVRDRVEELIERLTQIQIAYRALTSEDQAAFFYTLRDRYNARQADDVEQSAIFFALGRLAFNGLYRVSAQGRYNTPFGRYKNPDIVRADTLRAAHGVLQDATIVEADYQVASVAAQPSDLIYVDPPYAPVSKTANFTSYTADGFGWADQEKLASWIRDVGDHGVYVMASNADVPAIHELYRGLWIQVVPVRRAINSDASKRSGASEVIITTYPVNGASRG